MQLWMDVLLPGLFQPTRNSPPDSLRQLIPAIRNTARRKDGAFRTRPPPPTAWAELAQASSKGSCAGRSRALDTEVLGSLSTGWWFLHERKFGARLGERLYQRGVCPSLLDWSVRWGGHWRPPWPPLACRSFPWGRIGPRRKAKGTAGDVFNHNIFISYWRAKANVLVIYLWKLALKAFKRSLILTAEFFCDLKDRRDSFLSLVRDGCRTLNYLRIKFPIFHLLNKQKNICRKLMEKEVPCLSKDRVSKESISTSMFF